MILTTIPTVAHFLTKVYYRAIAAAAVELQWIRSLLTELQILVLHVPTIYSDNLGPTYLCVNPVFHTQMKHLAIDYNFVHNLVQPSTLLIIHVFSTDQLADALTRPFW